MYVPRDNSVLLFHQWLQSAHPGADSSNVLSIIAKWMSAKEALQVIKLYSFIFSFEKWRT